MSLELYKYAAQQLNDYFAIAEEQCDASSWSTVQADFDPDWIIDINGERPFGNGLTFSYQGSEYHISWENGWDEHQHRDGDTNPEFWSFQFNDEDEYFLTIEGNWDSWNGSSCEDDKVYVTKKRIIEDYVMEHVS